MSDPVIKIYWYLAIALDSLLVARNFKKQIIFEVNGIAHLKTIPDTKNREGAPGFEPGTSRSAVECSTTELYPHISHNNRSE